MNRFRQIVFGSSDDATAGRLFSNRDLLRLLIPLFIEQLLFNLVGTADTLMVASLGAAAVSAVSLSDMLNNFLASLFFAVSAGGAVVTSQFIGAKKLHSARESAGQLLFVVLIAGLVLAVIGEGFLGRIVHFLYGELAPDVYEATATYLRITLAGLPVIAVYGGCTALFRSVNRTRTTMYVSLAGNLLNIAGNAILIFGCGLGIAGAALATLLSRIFSMVVILRLTTSDRFPLSVKITRSFRPCWQLIRRILAIGIPGGIENGVFQFGRLIVLGLIASYGTAEIAANAVANTIDYFGCIPAYACGLAIVTVIGQAVGAGDRKQIRFYVRKMMRWACTAHAVWNVLLFLFTPLMLACFSKIEPETRRLAFFLILIHNGLGIIFWVFSFVFPNVLRAMNDVRWPMFISVGSMLVVRIGGAYALTGIVHSGVIAVWIAMIADWLVRIAGFLLRYRSGAWTQLNRYAVKK